MKRLFDLTLALFIAVLLLPVMFLVALVIRVCLGAPVIFQQQRPGLHGKPFMLRKFRSMSDARDSQGALLPDEARLGLCGSWLRRLSLDELPQLWNVIKGDMSLVGPRPLLMRYLPRYSPHQARRHEVRPGITGWAQVSGRNAISWEKRFELDVWYVDNQSFGLDLKILAMTACKVLAREGTRAEGHATMPEFMGKTGDGL